MPLNSPENPDMTGNPNSESPKRRKIKADMMQILIKRHAFSSVSSPFRYACCGPMVYCVSDVALEGGTYGKLTFVANFRLVKVSLRWA